MRKQFSGVVTVFRLGPLTEEVSAEFLSDNGQSFTYFKCPTSFFDLANTNGRSNKFAVSFTANEDGSNPRSVKAVQGN